MIGLGLGPLLMRRIIDYARGQGLRRIYGEVLRENEQMLRLNRALDFQVQRHPEDSSMMHVTLDL
jgi:acetyltransferase